MEHGQEKHQLIGPAIAPCVKQPDRLITESLVRLYSCNVITGWEGRLVGLRKYYHTTHVLVRARAGEQNVNITIWEPASPLLPLSRC